MKKQVVIFLCILILPTIKLMAQPTDELKDHVVRTLKPVSDPTQPGVSVAILQNGESVVIQANGLANVTTGAISSTNTTYQIDAMAKQFTTLAFLQLIKKGTIALEDNINKYLPSIPTFKYPITLKHVLNHTTGLNNYTIVHQLKGLNPSMGMTNSDALQLIAAQKELPHQAGSQFSFFDSNTETLLMAEIIASASGMSFVDFMSENIFLPLELNSARYIDNHERIRPTGAIAYQDIDGEQFRISDANNIVGPTNLYISIADIARWYSFFSPENKGKSNISIKELDTAVKNDKGEPYVSGWGKMTIGRSHLHLERGVPKYWQFGLKGGYGANVFRFPEQDITTVVLGNNNAYNGYYAMEIISPLIENEYKYPPAIDINSIETTPITSTELTRWNGEYFNSSTGQVRHFDVRRDTLRYVRGENAITLVPVGERSFQAILQSDDVLIFHFNGSGTKRYYDVISGGADPLRYEIIDDRYALDELSLLQYTGIYVNEDLGQIYKLSIDDGGLVANHYLTGQTIFRPISSDVFASLTYALSSIQFKRIGGGVTGFNITAGGIGRLFFTKVKKINPLIE